MNDESGRTCVSRLWKKEEKKSFFLSLFTPDLRALRGGRVASSWARRWARSRRSRSTHRSARTRDDAASLSPQQESQRERLSLSRHQEARRLALDLQSERRAEAACGVRRRARELRFVAGSEHYGTFPVSDSDFGEFQRTRARDLCQYSTRSTVTRLVHASTTHSLKIRREFQKAACEARCAAAEDSVAEAEATIVELEATLAQTQRPTAVFSSSSRVSRDRNAHLLSWGQVRQWRFSRGADEEAARARRPAPAPAPNHSIDL